MRKLFIASTLVFGLAVCGFWLASAVLTPPEAGAGVVQKTTEPQWSAEEVARHDRPTDCWMILGREVFDFSTYLPQHPSDPDVITPWCGKDASEAYLTKTKGRPHSPYADSLLPKYRIGVLK
ncbi:cytochrome b5 domain-containing protein [Azoarcus sp. L1K30]|uniref:cytochrome b5 domain-containing protein n=1 Tax=Azoarcus sp. L1K30 TaxID=2820277 RepID=UPI001B82F59B|nr:cytochrome b5-like heme/steroid binding domain-containing protein [Azoarcus sp. L1K30]MBR0567499.1 cytochrome b5 domain-containing protein [Azoarcus sp. L1K30]